MNIPLLKNCLKGLLAPLCSLGVHTRTHFASPSGRSRGWSLLFLVGIFWGCFNLDDSQGQCTGSVNLLPAINVQDSSATIVWNPIVGIAPISYQVTVQEDTGGTIVLNSFVTTDTFVNLIETLDADQLYDVNIIPVCNRMPGGVADTAFAIDSIGHFATLSELPSITLSNLGGPPCSSGTMSDGSIRVDYTSGCEDGTTFDLVYIQGGTGVIASALNPVGNLTNLYTVTTLDEGTYQFALVVNDTSTCNFDINPTGADTIAISNEITLSTINIGPIGIRANFSGEGDNSPFNNANFGDTMLVSNGSTDIVVDLGLLEATCDTILNWDVEIYNNVCDLDSVFVSLNGIIIGTGGQGDIDFRSNEGYMGLPYRTEQGLSFPEGQHELIFQTVDVNGNKSDQLIYQFEIDIMDPSDPIAFLALSNAGKVAGSFLQSNVTNSRDTIIDIVSGNCDTTLSFIVAAVDSCGAITDSISIDSGMTFKVINGIDFEDMIPTDGSDLGMLGGIDFSGFMITDTTSAEILTGSGSTIGPMTFDVGAHQVIYKATDFAGNASSDTLNIIIRDIESLMVLPPSNFPIGKENDTIKIESCASVPSRYDFEFNLNNNCGALDRLEYRIDGMATSDLSQDYPFNDTIMVEVIAFDQGILSDTFTYWVAVFDTIAPIANCLDEVPINLDASGTYTLTADELNDGSIDNCTNPVMLNIPSTTFTCTNVNTLSTITLTVSDAVGNTATCTSDVIITDFITITTEVRNTTVQCDQAIIEAPFANFDCNDMPIYASPISGEVPFMITASGVPVYLFQSNGLSARQIIWFFPQIGGGDTQIITFEADETAPEAVCLTNATISTDTLATITVNAAALVTATDNCYPVDSLTFTASMTEVVCDSLGRTFDIDIYVADPDGNADTCTATVTVEDQLAPVYLNVPANDTIDCSADIPAMADLTPVDNCGMVDSTYTRMESTQDSVVTNPGYYNYKITYTWAARDTAMNLDSVQQIIVVQDTLGPVISYEDTILVTAVGNDCMGSIMLDLGAAISDNCSDSLKSVLLSVDSNFTTTTTIVDTNDIISIDSIFEDSTIYLRAMDFSNNVTTRAITIEVNDQTAPIASCATSVTVTMSALGTLVLTPEDINQNSRDACSIPTLAIDRDTFTCEDINQQIPITLTATDSDGNTASCVSQVTIRPGTSGACNTAAECNGFSISLPTTNETVAGANDGTASVTPNGGSGTFTYQWVNSVTQIFSTSSAVTGLAPGSYTVTVRDAANPTNCVITGNITIATGPEPTDCDITVSYPTLINESRAGAADGAVTAMGSRANSAAFTYVWFNMAGTVIGTNAGISELAAGNYAVLVRDAVEINCLIRDTITIGTGSQTCDIGVTLSKVNETMPNANDGSATAAGTGASGNYTYAWTTPSGAVLTTPTIASLTPGVYNVTVRDAVDAQCFVTDSVTIEAAMAPDTCNIALSFTGIMAESEAGANDGSATAVVTGDAGSYTYFWVDGAGNTIDTTAMVNNLAPGTYTVTVREADNQDCFAREEVVIAPGMPSITTNTQFIVSNIEGAPNSVVQVPIIVRGFTDVTGFDLSLNIADGTMARFVPNTLMENAAFPTSQPISTPVETATNIELIWTGSTPLADDAVLFTVEVELLGAAGATVPITIGGIGNQVGEVTIQPQGGEPVEPVVGAPTLVNGSISIVAPNTFQLGGRIIHPDGTTGISAITVNLSTEETTETDDTGNYVFDVAAAGTYTITPFEDTNFNGSGGVNLVDVQEIQAHIVRNDPLDNHYELIAADADRNGVIESRDLSHIIRTALLNVPFPENTSWRFVPTDYTFPTFTDFGNPVTDYPEMRTVTNPTMDALDQDFVGIKIGDVASNFATRGSNFTAGATSRSAFQFVIKDQSLRQGDLISIPVKANNFQELVGYQMTLATSGSLELMEVIPGAIQDISAINFGQTTPTADISTLWVSAFPSNYKADEVLFTLAFRVHTDRQLLSEVLDITSDQIAAYGLDKDFNPTSIGLVFEETAAAGIFEVYQNRPNPFKGNTTISFNLPTREVATIRVFDFAGRQVFNLENEFAKGYNEVTLQSKDFPSAGILYYEVTAADQVARRKMIMIE